MFAQDDGKVHPSRDQEGAPISGPSPSGSISAPKASSAKPKPPAGSASRRSSSVSLQASDRVTTYPSGQDCGPLKEVYRGCCGKVFPRDTPCACSDEAAGKWEEYERIVVWIWDCFGIYWGNTHDPKNAAQLHTEKSAERAIRNRELYEMPSLAWLPVEEFYALLSTMPEALRVGDKRSHLDTALRTPQVFGQYYRQVLQELDVPCIGISEFIRWAHSHLPGESPNFSLDEVFSWRALMAHEAVKTLKPSSLRPPE